MNTREKILQASVELFNEKGISTVTLRDIADQVGISIGNLAYHFKNKDFIITELFRSMESERQQRLSEVQLIPSFENANRQTLAILRISFKYRFFYLHTLDILRAYPDIARLHRKQVEDNIEYVRAILAYSVGTGNMKSEPYPGCYRRLSETVWTMLHFWLLGEAVRGVRKHSPNEARMTMWSLVEPHLTEKGRRNFPVIHKKVQHADS